MSMPFGTSETVDSRQLQALADELAKHIKTEQDIAALSRQLLKLSVESALNAELEAHLGYAKHARQGTGNRRNGSSAKTLKGEIGEVEIRTPRDRNGSFEPQIVKLGNTVSLIGSIMFALIILFGIYFTFKKTKTKNEK